MVYYENSHVPFKISSLGAKFAITGGLLILVGIIVMVLVIDRLVSPNEKIYKLHSVLYKKGGFQ